MLIFLVRGQNPLKDNSSVFVSVITCNINRSLSTGIFPKHFRTCYAVSSQQKKLLNPEEILKELPPSCKY